MTTPLDATDTVRRRLYEALRRDVPFEEKARRALELGREFLDADSAHLARIDSDAGRWEALVSTSSPDGGFPPDPVLDLETTYCRHAIESDSELALHDAPGQGWEDDPALEIRGLRCYHGTPLVVDGEPFGTVCFVATAPRSEPFTAGEMLVAELIAHLLERELERGGGPLRRATRIADVGGWEIDPDTRELVWSDHLSDLLGLDGEGPTLDGEEVTLDGALENRHDGDRTALETAIESALETGEPFDTDVRYRPSDGETRWLRVIGVPETENGDVESLRGVVQDITVRKAREERLSRRAEEFATLSTRCEERYRRLFENAPVMAVITTVEDGRRVVTECNQRFADAVGYDDEAIVGRELAEFYAPGSKDVLETGGDRGFDEAQTTPHRRLVTADGEVVETHMRDVPHRNESDGSVETLAMYIDITEREEVKRTNERLEEFVSTVSHDLRNPLSVARGYLTLAREENDSPELAQVDQAHERMNDLIVNLLALAREGIDVSGTEVVDLQALCQECWKHVDTRDAVLTLDVSGAVRASEPRLKRLLENLIRNAIEHGGDTVTVRVGECRNGFYVEDTGPGIPEADRDRVFDTSYSTSDDGNGLGLSIVKQIVDAHGWEIAVTEGAEGGARFEITAVEFADPQPQEGEETGRSD